MNLIGHLILVDVVLILLLEHILGNLDGLAKLVGVQKRVAHRVPFRHLVLRFVFLVLRLDFRVGGRDFGFQIFRLDQRIIEFYLFVFVAVLLLELGRADADPIRHELPEFLLEQPLPDQLFESGNGKLEALLDQGGVLIHSDEGPAVESHRKIQADAVGAFLVGNRDSQALGFVFQLPLKNQVL